MVSCIFLLWSWGRFPDFAARSISGDLVGLVFGTLVALKHVLLRDDSFQLGKIRPADHRNQRPLLSIAQRHIERMIGVQEGKLANGQDRAQAEGALALADHGPDLLPGNAVPSRRT